MIKRFSNFVFNSYNGFFVASGVILLLLATGIYLLLGNRASDALVEQMLHREQLSVRAGSRSLASFFDLFERPFIELAQDSNLKSLTPSTKASLDNFTKSWFDTPVAGVILTDKNGIIKFNSNRDNNPTTGIDVSDRDYFTWAKTAKSGEKFISSPLISRAGASLGKYIITITTPIVGDDGDFRGVLTAALFLDELSDDYIKPLKVTDSSYVYLVNESGDVLASDQANASGNNFFDQINKVPFIGSTILSKNLKEIIVSRKEGKLKAAFPIDPTRPLSLTEMLIAYSPVVIGNDHFTVATATPKKEALLYLTPFYFGDLSIAALVFLALLIIAVRISKVRGYIEGIEKEQREHGELPPEK